MNSTEGAEEPRAPRIIYNAVLCGTCGDTIESTHRHDFKYCSCGAVAVDGGLDYLRRVGDFKNSTDVSLYEGQEDELLMIRNRTAPKVPKEAKLPKKPGFSKGRRGGLLG